MERILFKRAWRIVVSAVIIFVMTALPVSEVHAAPKRSPKNILAQNEGRYTKAVEKILAGGVSFSRKKVACLGDSLTYGLDGATKEVTSQSYPYYLQLFTGAEVLNYGIGGSTIGTSNVYPMCERYSDIPKDADYIIVFGGINDSFYVTKDAFGSMEEPAPGTFIGEMALMFYGLKTEYPDSEIIIVNPPKSLWQYQEYQRGRGSLVKQEKYSDAIRLMTEAYGFHLIDLYDENILNSLDKNVRERYVPDGCHPNENGYNLLAGIIAEKMIDIEMVRLMGDPDT